MKKYISNILLFLFFVVEIWAQSSKSSVKELYISKIPKVVHPPNLTLGSITFDDTKGNNNRKLDASENAEIKFSLSNEGKGNAYNLVVEVHETKQIKGVQYQEKLYLNDLESGKKIPVKIPLYSSKELESGEALFEIIIKEGNGYDSDRSAVSFLTQKFKNPLVRIAEHKFSNQEGKIQLGKTVTLEIIVQNRGQGEAKDVRVLFINPPNVDNTTESNFYIGNLRPNETRIIKYEFSAKKIYSDKEIPITVRVEESFSKYGETKDVTVLLDETLSKTQIVKIDANYDQPILINDVSLTSDVDKNIPFNNTKDEDKYALIIGNEDYTSSQTDLTNEVNVDFAINDADVFKQYCLKTFGVPQKNIFYLTNATAANIKQAINKLNGIIDALDGKAKIIVYYAGHGLPDETTKEPYLIPVDVSGTDISAGIKLSYLYEKLTEYPSQQVTVFIDACFSGGARESGLLAARGIKIKPNYDLLKGNIVVFTASSNEESSLPWKEKQHGMFTYFVLKKFQETEGNFTFSELQNYLKSKVNIESLKTNNKKQNPQILISPDVTSNWGQWKLD
jgi:hypothetical protein